MLLEEISDSLNYPERSMFVKHAFCSEEFARTVVF